MPSKTKVVPSAHPKEDTGGGILCRAAHALADEGLAPFTPQALAVRAWELRPDKFGLAGYRTTYPDFNAVRSSLSGWKGMIRRGYLVSLPGGLLAPGRPWREAEPCKRAPTCQAEKTPASEEEKSPAEPLCAVRMRASKAAERLRGGRRDSITLAECLDFYGLPCEPAVERLKWAMTYAAQIFADRSTPELRWLGALHDYLTGRFSRFLERQKPVVKKKIKRGKVTI